MAHIVNRTAEGKRGLSSEVPFIETKSNPSQNMLHCSKQTNKSVNNYTAS